MKRITCLVLSLLFIVAATFLGACGKDPSTQVKDDLVFDKYGDPVFDNVKLNVWSVIGSPDNEYLDKVNNMFNDYYRNNGLSANIVSIDTSQYYTQLANAIVTDPDNAPDVVIFHSERLTDMVASNLLVSMDECFSYGGLNFKKSNYLENVMAECVVKGTTYAVPLDVHSGVWFVRSDILEKNGLEMPTNRAEFEKVCQDLMDLKAAGRLFYRAAHTGDTGWKIAEPSSDFYPVEASASGGIENGWLPQTMVFQNGGTLVDSKGMPAWQTSDGLKNNLQMFRDWQGKYIGKNRDYNTLWSNLASGMAVFGCEGPWWIEQRMNEYEALLANVPDVNGKTYKPLEVLGLSNLYAEDASSSNANKVYGVGHCFGVTRVVTSKAKRLAGALYAQYMTEHATDYMAGGHLPACKSVLESEEYLSSKAYNRYLKNMGDPHNMVMLGNTPYYSEVYEQLKMTYIYVFTASKKNDDVTKIISDCYNKAINLINSKNDL